MTAWRTEGMVATQGPFRMGPVDLEVASGETIAIIGPSGAGKTTLLRGVAGLAPLGAGRVVRGGEDVSRAPPEHRRLAYVPQGLGLFPHLTARGNVRFAARLHPTEEAEGRTDRLLRRFRLEGFAGRRPSQLSTGEQQRVAVARALAAEPELLLWDEPLGALDVVAREELLETLAAVREEYRVPLLLVTHDPSIAYSLADRFLLLDAGRVRFLGGAAALVERPGDPFVARFLGYENVFSRASLADRAAVGLGAWLRERSGSLGVAFSAGAVAVDRPGPGSWEATVRRREPTPAGVRLDLDAGGVALRAVVAVGTGERAPAGTRVSVTLDERALHPLEGWP